MKFFQHYPIAVTIIACLIFTKSVSAQSENKKTSLYSKKNAVAWCIVPFDAKKRGPAQRAKMVKRLGLSKVAYDWRAKDVPTFEEEILQYKKHNIEFFAFWSWHDSMAPLIKKHGIKPQIWITCSSPNQSTQSERIEAAAKSLLPLVKKTSDLGLKLGLYNHGGWGGEPQNLVAVCKYLHKNHNAKHVGIVYNFHHGHGHIEDFSKVFKMMQPYLLCLNLNGMNDEAAVKKNGKNKIVTIGSGKHEKKMMKIVLDSGYKGPIGVLDHRMELDAEVSVRQNLEGLEKLRNELE